MLSNNKLHLTLKCAINIKHKTSLTSQCSNISISMSQVRCNMSTKIKSKNKTLLGSMLRPSWLVVLCCVL